MKFRMREVRRLLAVAALGVLALSVASCGGSSGDDEGGTIKVGASLPLTGPGSEPGTAAKQGYEVWEALTNENGGLIDGREVEMVIKDDASNQNTVVTDYNALISKDNVDLLLGTFSSLLNLPASSVAERNKMLFVEPAGGAPELFERGFKTIFFAQQATADHQGDLWAEWLLSLPEDERPATAAYPSSDDPFSAATADAIREQLEAGGIETVYQETYPLETKNFDAIASAVKASGAEIVVNGAGFEDGVGVIRAFLKADYKPELLFQTSAPSLGEQYAEGVGPGNTDGITYAVSYNSDAPTPGNKEFVAKYREMFGGGEVPEDAADAYAAAQVLAAAVNGVGSVAREDQLELADWLRENEVETILGTLKWNETGAPEGEFLIGQWQHEKAEVILPKDAATTDEIIPTWQPQG